MVKSGGVCAVQEHLHYELDDLELIVSLPEFLYFLSVREVKGHKYLWHQAGMVLAMTV